MNETPPVYRMNNYLSSGAWGRAAGEIARGKFESHTASAAPPRLIRLDMSGVTKIDVSCASAAIAELIKDNIGRQYFFLTNLPHRDVTENIAAAAQRLDVPVAVRLPSDVIQMIGRVPSAGTRAALAFALEHTSVRAAEFAQTANLSIANASNKLKTLWQQGFVMRSQALASSGGAEYVYQRIG